MKIAKLSKILGLKLQPNEFPLIIINDCKAWRKRDYPYFPLGLPKDDRAYFVFRIPNYEDNVLFIQFSIVYEFDGPNMLCWEYR